MMYKSVRGMEDILPEKAFYWRMIEDQARKVFSAYGYSEVILPLVETTEVFLRTLGDASDIVNKEMYTFNDRKGRSLTLRPEGTASVVRAVIENGLLNSGNCVKLFYVGPMFRYERPQAGRKRQFFQIGVEFFGSDSFLADCETVLCMTEIFRNLDIPVAVRVNTLGCKKCSEDYTAYLKKELIGAGASKINTAELCEDCRSRTQTNVLRVLDCKNEKCKKLLSSLSPISSMVCDDDKKQFSLFTEKLKAFGINYKVDNTLVRGLDYYTGMIYEAYLDDSSGNAMAGGGRYNDLVSLMGGPDTPAVGFAAGVDRAVEYLMEKTKSTTPSADVFLVSIGARAIDENFRLLISLRKKGIKAEMEYSEKSPKSQFRKANALRSGFVIIRGDEEIEKSVVKIKRMSDGSEFETRESEVESIICGRNNEIR